MMIDKLLKFLSLLWVFIVFCLRVCSKEVKRRRRDGRILSADTAAVVVPFSTQLLA